MDNKVTIHIDASRSIDSIQKTGVENVSDEILKNLPNWETDLVAKVDLLSCLQILN